MNTDKNQKAMAKLPLDAQTAALFGLKAEASTNQPAFSTRKEAYMANPKPNTVGWFAPPPPPEEE